MTKADKLRRSTSGLFLNRELSWLEFNHRVLEEARDVTNPLLERLKFATIVASNLDEFFMVRVAGLKRQVEDGDTAPDPSGLTPVQQLVRISERAHAMVTALGETLQREILPGLAGRGIAILAPGELEEGQRAWIETFFRGMVLPALTPLAIDASRPFPMLANLSLNLGVLLGPDGEEADRLAIVQVPARIPRLMHVPGEGHSGYVWLEEAIRTHLGLLFPGQEILGSAIFRIARDAELELDDEGGVDFVENIEDELRRRRRGAVVRLEVEAGSPRPLLERLAGANRVAPEDTYEIWGPLDLRGFLPLLELPGLEDLRDLPMKPLPAPELEPGGSVFDAIEQQDILLHHPYDAFDPVVGLVSEAAADPDVLAIKQTLYRTSGDSAVVQALARAAEGGKQVTVLVELLARFDEERNILWAHRLEEAGAHVIYRIRGYKTHAKVLLIVRRTSAGIRRYVHLATGNYNERTARLYTDFGLMTADARIGEDASSFFNALTGYSDPPAMKKLVMAPTRLRERFLDLVRREQRRAEAGQDAEIRAKMNSLVDGDLIDALYEASKAGVRIRLNVRGICRLRPGVKGTSERIEVVSIVDRFLEHSRIFYFRNGGDEEVYLSSADWMPRNLDRRIELLFPVEAPECRRRVLHALDAMLRDNVKGRVLLPDGSYKLRRPARGEEPLRAQVFLYQEAQRLRDRTRAAAGIVFDPIRSPEKPAAGV